MKYTHVHTHTYRYIDTQIYCISPQGLPEQSTQTGGLKQQKLFSHNSEGQQSIIEVPAGLDSPEASLLGGRMTIISLHLPMILPLYMCVF